MQNLLTSISLSSFKMRTITKDPLDSFSFSRRYFNLKRKSENDEEGGDDDEGEEGIVTLDADEIEEHKLAMHSLSLTKPPKKKKLPLIRVSKLKSLLSFGKTSSSSNTASLGSKVIVTVFGYSRSRVHLAFQEDIKLNPFFLVEMATPTSVLVREMASGVVRIALECERKKKKSKETIFEEKIWRTYCNGKKCGYATSRECGAEERRILDLVGPVSMGVGMLPEIGESADGDLMYIRARFERVVGSKESEAFYMLNPDRNGRNELCIYLLRV